MLFLVDVMLTVTMTIGNDTYLHSTHIKIRVYSGNGEKETHPHVPEMSTAPQPLYLPRQPNPNSPTPPQYVANNLRPKSSKCLAYMNV